MDSVVTIINLLRGRLIKNSDFASLELLCDLQQRIDLDRIILEGKIKMEVADQQIESPEVTGKITYKSGAYYRGDKGPCCPNCWDKSNLLIQMEIADRQKKGSLIAHCPICGTYLKNKS